MAYLVNQHRDIAVNPIYFLLNGHTLVCLEKLEKILLQIHLARGEIEQGL
jgi:hypothetical protein